MANGNVIYLPPGVMPPPGPSAQAMVPSGVPFDRTFFEQVLPRAISAFCQSTACEVPRVELLTVDGTTHFVNSILGVADAWVALQVAREDHDHAIQVFIPYQTIFRVEVHPEEEIRRRIGFIRETEADRLKWELGKQAPAVDVPVVDVPVEDAPTVPAEKPAARKKPSPRSAR